jgi:ADP-ribose pyrophosphatase
MLPSGKVDTTGDADLIAAAQRELREETGYRAHDLQHVQTCFYSESFAFRAHIYVGRELVHDPLPQDDNELIEVHELAIVEAQKRVLEQRPVHALSAFALSLALQNFPK